MLNSSILSTLRANLQPEEMLMRGGIVTEPGTQRAYFTGYNNQILYDWDQYFEAIVQIYMGWPSEYIRNGVMIFLERQQPNGLISRSVPSNELHDPEHVKPFLCQVALLVERAYGEVDWILREDTLARLEKYLDYWLVEMDENRNGLSEWMSAPHTGMDNQQERAGSWNDRFCEGVDLNAYLVRELKSFAHLCDLAGKPELGQRYRGLSEQRAERMRELMWDDADGFFYDHNARAGQYPLSRRLGWAAAINENAGELIRVRSMSSFAALWAGVATSEQAARMIQGHLFNPREFYGSYPFPALARSERWYSHDRLPSDLGCNWRAKTWIPTNYMAYLGLRRYGYHQLASLVARETELLVKRAGNCEYYDAETGEGCGMSPFWGWSLLGHFMPYEETLEENITLIG